MQALYVTVKKLIKAKQLQCVESVTDRLTGERFIGQPGDWKIQDEDGHTYIMSYHQFIQRYRPHNYEAFCEFSCRRDNYNKRGKLILQIKRKIKQDIDQNINN